MADVIMIIRHAEKPGKQPPPFGVTRDGSVDGHDLSVIGWQRAGGLALLFGKTEVAAQRSGLDVPKTIYATRPDVANPSKRPHHTVLPLAKVLGIDVLLDFTVSQESELAAAAAAAAGPVLICWHHEAIPAIGAALLGETPDTVGDWDDDRFDLVWHFGRSGSGWSFSKTSQMLLAGDHPASG
jgi:hypothetical protein